MRKPVSKLLFASIFLVAFASALSIGFSVKLGGSPASGNAVAPPSAIGFEEPLLDSVFPQRCTESVFLREGRNAKVDFRTVVMEVERSYVGAYDLGENLQVGGGDDRAVDLYTRVPGFKDLSPSIYEEHVVFKRAHQVGEEIMIMSIGPDLVVGTNPITNISDDTTPISVHSISRSAGRIEYGPTTSGHIVTFGIINTSGMREAYWCRTDRANGTGSCYAQDPQLVMTQRIIPKINVIGCGDPNKPDFLWEEWMPWSGKDIHVSYNGAESALYTTRQHEHITTCNDMWPFFLYGRTETYGDKIRLGGIGFPKLNVTLTLTKKADDTNFAWSDHEGNNEERYATWGRHEFKGQGDKNSIMITEIGKNYEYAIQHTSADPLRPDVDRNTIVFEDSRNGGSIYAAHCYA